MKEYIEREAALLVIANNNYSDSITLERYDAIINGLYSLPAADVVELRHGRWIPDKDLDYCSECGCEKLARKRQNYCPNCGAKMDGGADDGKTN